MSVGNRAEGFPYCFCPPIMEICDVLVAVAVVVPLAPKKTMSMPSSSTLLDPKRLLRLKTIIGTFLFCFYVYKFL